MPSALVPLANLTLSAAQASISLTSISGSYRDLRIICRTTSTTAGGGYIRFNSDSGSNYSSVWAFSSGGSTGSNSTSGTSFSMFGMLNGNANTDIFEILDYSATDKHKTMLNRYDSPQADGTYMIADRWASTSAITSIVFTATTGNFASGSTFALYGVSA